MKNSKIPPKKTSNLFSFQKLNSKESFLDTSTQGDPTTTCTTVLTRTHLLTI